MRSTLFHVDSQNPPPRWAGNTPEQAYVWEYYSSLAAKLIQEAMTRPNLTLLELMRTLAGLRFKCEWVKRNLTTTKLDYLQTLARCSISLSDMSKYGHEQLAFGQHHPGGLAEYWVDIVPNWGESVVRLTNERITKGRILNNDFGAIIAKKGLSVIRSRLCVHHPTGYIIDQLEQKFKLLLSVNHFFNFIDIASQIIFSLSNFTQLVRGSAAVSKWIFDGVMKAKFGMTSSIIPTQYDWIAFYETSEQYRHYFIITTIANYLKSFNDPDIDDALLNSVNDRMILDSNIEVHAAGREDLWLQIRGQVAKLYSKLSDNQFHAQLCADILSGKLIFRKPRSDIKVFVDDILSKPGELADASITALDHETVSYINSLYEMHHNMGDEYLKIMHEVDHDDEFNQKWIDLEYMNLMPFDKLASVFKILGNDVKVTSNNLNSNKDENFGRHLNTSFLPRQELCQFPSKLVETLNQYYSKKASIPFCLQNAVLTGRVNLANIAVLYADDIEDKVRDEILSLISCDLAMLIYNSDRFIQSTDFMAQTPEETRLKLIRTFIGIYCPDIAKRDDCEMIYEKLSQNFNRMQQTYLTCFINTGKLDLSVFIDDDEKIIKRKLLREVIKNIFNESDGCDVVDILNDFEVERVLYSLNSLYFYHQYDFCAFGDCLHRSGLRLHELIRFRFYELDDFFRLFHDFHEESRGVDFRTHTLPYDEQYKYRCNMSHIKLNNGMAP